MNYLGWATGAFVVSRIIKKEKKRQQAKDKIIRAFLNMFESDYDDENEDEYGYTYKQ